MFDIDDGLSKSAAQSTECDVFIQGAVGAIPSLEVKGLELKSLLLILGHGSIKWALASRLWALFLT